MNLARVLTGNESSCLSRKYKSEASKNVRLAEIAAECMALNPSHAGQSIWPNVCLVVTTTDAIVYSVQRVWNTTKVQIGGYLPPTSCANPGYGPQMTPHYVARTIRLSTKQDRILQRLSEKLSLDATSVLRLALAKLAESEGVK